MYPLRSSSKQLLFLLLSETISCSLRHLLVPKRYISLPSRACRKKVCGRETCPAGGGVDWQRCESDRLVRSRARPTLHAIPDHRPTTRKRHQGRREHPSLIEPSRGEASASSVAQSAHQE